MRKIILLVCLFTLINPAIAKRVRDKSYIVASGLLTTGSILLLCVNPLIGGSFLVAGGMVHLYKSIKGNKVEEIKPATS